MNQFCSNSTTDSMQCNRYPSRTFSRNYKLTLKFTWDAKGQIGGYLCALRLGKDFLNRTKKYHKKGKNS